MTSVSAYLPGAPAPAPGLSVNQLAGRTGLRLSGQADWRALGLIRQAVAALPPDADKIHLQLAGLEYIDLAAARELVLLTARPGRPRLVLDYPPLVLLRLLRLLRLCWPEARARIDLGATRPDSIWAGSPWPRKQRKNPGSARD